MMMLPFFAKLSEQIKEKVYSLLVGPGLRDKKRKRQTNEMEAVNTNRGPRAKKMKMNKSEEEEERGRDARKKSCFNNNHEAEAEAEAEDKSASGDGGEARNPSASGKQEEATENESPLKALLSIKKEPGGSWIRGPGARNPYSLRNIHSLGSTRVVNWTEEQLEILRSALAAYRYSPRTTRDRVFWELRMSHRGGFFTKEDVGKWWGKC